MGTLFVDKLDPQSGTSLEIGSSGDTISVPSGATINLSNATQTGVGGVNTPAFEAYSAATQNLVSATTTKVIFATEAFDTDNAYDNSTNYRFTPLVAGKYFVYTSLSMQSTDYTMYNSILRIRKNGSDYKVSPIITSNDALYAAPVTISAIIDMNGSSDYVEIFAYMELHSGSVRSLQPEVKGTYFGAYKIIE